MNHRRGPGGRAVAAAALVGLAACGAAVAGTGDGAGVRYVDDAPELEGTGEGAARRPLAGGTGAGETGQDAAGDAAAPGRIDAQALLERLRARHRQRGGAREPARVPERPGYQAPIRGRLGAPRIQAASGTEVGFDLARALRYAEEHSYLRQKFRHELEARRRSLDAAGTYPAMQMWAIHNREVDDLESSFKQEPFLHLRQPFDLFGNRRAARRVAARDVDLAALALEGFDQELSYQVAVAYRQLHLRQALYYAADFSEKLATRFLRVAELRRDAGTVPEIDVIRGQAELYKAREAKRAARIQLVAGRAALGRAMGYEEWERLSPEGRVRSFRVDADAAALLEQAVARRVDLRSLEVLDEKLAAEQGELRQRKKPVLSGAFEMKQDPGLDTAEFFGLRMDFTPLWYGKIGRQVDARHQMRRAVAAERRHFLRLVRIRLDELLQSVDLTRRRLALMEEREIPKNARQLETVERGYRAGGLDNLAVLNAQRTVIEVVTRYLGALREYHMQLLELRKEVGMAAVPTTPRDLSPFVEGWIFEGGL